MSGNGQPGNGMQPLNGGQPGSGFQGMQGWNSPQTMAHRMRGGFGDQQSPYGGMQPGQVPPAFNPTVPQAPGMGAGSGSWQMAQQAAALRGESLGTETQAAPFVLSVWLGLAPRDTFGQVAQLFLQRLRPALECGDLGAVLR